MSEGRDLDIFYRRIVAAARALVPVLGQGGVTEINAQAELLGAVRNLEAVEAAYQRAEEAVNAVRYVPNPL